MSETNNPFEGLGRQLKRLRTSRQESLAEVSGAVEIDANMLDTIEQGSARPSEDILLLLISHFGIKEEVAEKLWSLAGYEQNLPSSSSNSDSSKPLVMVTPEDLKIVYTDMVHVAVNDYGVIMNFMQGAGPNSQPLAIARVGMSREHALSVLEVLQQTLKNASPKELPAPKNNKKSNKNKS